MRIRPMCQPRAGIRGFGSGSDLAQLSDLHDRGVISDAEFERGKEKILQ